MIKPRSAILDLLSPRGRRPISAAAIVAACALFGISSNNTRVALARLVADGRLEKVGPASYALSEDAEAGNIKVDLNFKSLDDFSPENVARQVKPLRELLELRDRLSDLRGSMQGNDKLEEVLREAVTDKDKLAKLRSELGAEEPK